MLAASLLAEADGTARSRAARTRAVAGVMREVAGHLGNTPAVARSSYVDPRVVDLFHAGTTIPVLREREKTEKAVLELLGA